MNHPDEVHDPRDPFCCYFCREWLLTADEQTKGAHHACEQQHWADLQGWEPSDEIEAVSMDAF